MFYIFIVFLLIKNKYKFLLTSFFNQADIFDQANKVIFFYFSRLSLVLLNHSFDIKMC